MIRTFLLVAVASLLPALAPAQVPPPSPPHLFFNGKVAFNYLSGDIWIANDDGTGIQRLTDNIGREVYPRFSPDGNWIAFSSNREGNYDVYVVAATGGKPRQLTFHSADDNVVNWSPDGKKILFTSSRGNGVFPSVLTLYEIPPLAAWNNPSAPIGVPGPATPPTAPNSPSPRHPGVWSRKHYRGSYAVDLWLDGRLEKNPSAPSRRRR